MHRSERSLHSLVSLALGAWSGSVEALIVSEVTVWPKPEMVSDADLEIAISMLSLGRGEQGVKESFDTSTVCD